MRCRPMVVLPLPADPWIAIRPDDGCVISSNWRGSISAAIAGRWRSGRRAPVSSKPSLPRVAGDGGGGGSAGVRASPRGTTTTVLPSRAICRRAWRVATSRHFPVRMSRENVPCGAATRRRSASTIATVRRASISPSTSLSPRRSSYASPSS